MKATFFVCLCSLCYFKLSVVRYNIPCTSLLHFEMKYSGLSEGGHSFYTTKATVLWQPNRANVFIFLLLSFLADMPGFASTRFTTFVLFFLLFFAADSELLGSVMKNERGHFQMEIKPLIYLQFQFYFVSPTWKWFQYNFNCTLRPICLPSNYILYKTFQWHFKLPTNLNWTQLARSSLPEM